MYYNKIAWIRQSDEEKAESVCKILSMCTHNSITKDDLLMMLDWCFHEMYACENPCLGHKERCECLRVIKGVE